jgi:hypothetical protein
MISRRDRSNHDANNEIREAIKEEAKSQMIEEAVSNAPDIIEAGIDGNGSCSECCDCCGEAIVGGGEVIGHCLGAPFYLDRNEVVFLFLPEIPNLVISRPVGCPLFDWHVKHWDISTYVTISFYFCPFSLVHIVIYIFGFNYFHNLFENMVPFRFSCRDIHSAVAKGLVSTHALMIVGSGQVDHFLGLKG